MAKKYILQLIIAIEPVEFKVFVSVFVANVIHLLHLVARDAAPIIIMLETG